MSTFAHSGSTDTVYSRMTRAASMFSDTLTSFAVGSAITTRSMECGIEGPFSGSPQVVKRCPRLEAEISQLRKRLNSEMTLLPIVTSTDAGGLSCEFMFPVARGSPRKSITTAPPPVAVSHDVQELDVPAADQAVVDDGAQDRVRTETPQDVDPEVVEEARVAGIAADIEGPSIIESPTEDIISSEVDPKPDLLSSPAPADDGRQPIRGGVIEGRGQEVLEDLSDENGEIIVVCETTNDDCVGSSPDHHAVGQAEETEDVKAITATQLPTKPHRGERTDTKNESIGSQRGEQAIGNEEFPSSIGALVKRTLDASPLIAATDPETMDDTEYTALTLSSSWYPPGGVVLTPSGMFVPDLGLYLLGGSLSCRSVNIPHIAFVVQPLSNTRVLTPLRLTPVSSFRHLGNLSPHIPLALSSRRLQTVGNPLSSTSPLQQDTWQRPSCQKLATTSDDLISKNLVDLISLLLGVLLCSLLSNTAVYLFSLLWLLSDWTIRLPFATTTPTSGWRCVPDDSLVPCSQLCVYDTSVFPPDLIQHSAVFPALKLDHSTLISASTFKVGDTWGRRCALSKPTAAQAPPTTARPHPDRHSRPRRFNTPTIPSFSPPSMFSAQRLLGRRTNASRSPACV